MFATLTYVFGVFAIAARVAIATPPACMIGAVNQAQSPIDIKAVCKDNKVKSYLSSKCGNNLDTANEYFAGVCEDAGVTVSPSSASSHSHSHSTETSSKSPSGSSSATATKSSGTHSTTVHPSHVHGYQSASFIGGSAGTLSGANPVGTGGTASSGLLKATSNSTRIANTASPTSDSASGQPTESGPSSTGGAEKLSMDVVGLGAMGMLGAMLAL